MANMRGKREREAANAEQLGSLTKCEGGWRGGSCQGSCGLSLWAGGSGGGAVTRAFPPPLPRETVREV